MITGAVLGWTWAVGVWYILQELPPGQRKPEGVEWLMLALWPVAYPVSRVVEHVNDRRDRLPRGRGKRL